MKQLVPVSARPWMRRQWRRVAHFGWKRQCPVCGARLSQFAAHGDPPEAEAVCPICHSKAPHRLAYRYFADHRELFEPGKTFLHIAPERELGRRLADWCAQAGMIYRSGDIGQTGEQYLDLREARLPDRSIDVVFCSHVYNMIDDDRRALRETFRIVHGRGVAVLQVPAFCQEQTTVEPATESERVRIFRDPLMYRCYTEADFVDRLESAGFRVETVRASDYPAGEVEGQQLKRELLHVCRKP